MPRNEWEVSHQTALEGKVFDRFLRSCAIRSEISKQDKQTFRYIVPGNFEKVPDDKAGASLSTADLMS